MGASYQTISSSKVSLVKKPCTVNSLIIRTATAFANALKATNLTLIQDIDQAERTITVDDNRITPVLSNLLGNAIKFSTPGDNKRSSSTASADGSKLVFCVSASGCGISQDDQPHRFDRLHQANEVNHEFMGAGLGLGLTIAKEIVALHNGKLWVESEVDIGGHFFFELPLTTTNNMIH